MAKIDPRLGSVILRPGCKEIQFFRRAKGFEGARAFMHVGHVKNSVCAIRNSAALSDGHLVGLFLHEFGHLAGGDSEPAANDWVKRHLSVEIKYKAPLDLQWVPPAVVRWVLG